MRRIDVVVPAGALAALRIPARAVTTGEATTEWADVPYSRWRFARRPAQRLPLDPRSARRARRYARLAPWYPAVLLPALLVGLAGGFTDLRLPAAAPVVFFAIPGIWLLPGVGGALPRQTPRRTASGGLRLPAVPADVAAEWAARNPGVTLTDEPEPRRRSRRFYARWAAGLVAGGTGLGAVLAGDSREDPFPLWLTVLALVIAGLVMTAKTLPPGYIGLERPEAD